MLDEVRPDVVHVLTPPWEHVDGVEVALTRGVHVICEKPLAPTLAQAKHLFDLAERQGCRLVENQNYRFNDEVRAIESHLARDGIGPVREVEIRLALTVVGSDDPQHRIHLLPAGAVHDVITHLAYLLDHLSGRAEWSEIAAHWRHHQRSGSALVDDLDAILVGEREGRTVHGRLRCSPGTAPEAFELTIRGERGEVEAELFHPRLSVRRERRTGPQLGPVVDHVVNGGALAWAGPRNLARKLLGHSPYHGLALLLRETYEALTRGMPPPVSRRDVERAASLVDRLVATR